MSVNIKKLDIRVKSHDGVYIREKTDGSSVLLIVSIPPKPVGIDEYFKIQNEGKVRLEGCPHSHKAYTLTVLLHNDSRIRLKLHRMQNNLCHVEITKFTVRCNTFVRILADKISVSSKTIKICESGLTLDSQRDIRINSILRCPNVLLKSKSGDIRLSSESVLKVDSIEAEAKTTFVDGNIVCLSQTCNSGRTVLYSRTNLDQLTVTITGDLHLGRDGLIGSTRHIEKVVNASWIY